MKKSSLFLILIIFGFRLFYGYNKDMVNAGITAFTISKQLTYCDRDFFVGLGLLAKVERAGVEEYVKKSKKFEKNSVCKKVKFRQDIKSIKIEKKKIYWFGYKQSGEILDLVSFFKYKGRKYFLASHNSMNGHKMFLYMLGVNNIERIKEVKLSYIKVMDGVLYGTNTKKPCKLFILDDNFKIVKSIKLKYAQYFYTDIYKCGKEFYFKKVRFKSYQPGFVSETGKMFFGEGQGEGKSIFEGYMRNQIIMGEDKKRVYISFMFPDVPHYPVYIYKKTGECEKSIYGRINEYIWIPRGNWFENVFPGKYMEIVSVNKIFPDLGKIFVIIHRNTGGKVGKTKKFIQVISKKGKFMGEREIKVLGFPVFYDRDEKCFYSVRKKDFSIRKWSLKINFY